MKKRFWAMAGVLLVLALGARGADKSSELRFLVVKDYNGKPVRNASVILHPVRKDGKQDRGGFQLKTDLDGKTSFEGVPYGRLRVQVLARGFQTFGEDYEINQPTTEITVKLKQPAGQYSIYEDKQNDKKDDKTQEEK
jgi:hypothetical protein